MKSNMLRAILLAMGVVSIAALANDGTAAPTVFFARDNSTSSMPNSQAKFAQFTAGLNSFGVDNIETVAGVEPTLTFGATGITAQTQGVFAQLDPGFGIALDTQALLELDAAGAGQVNTVFTFSQYISAFGLFAIQAGDGLDSNTITFRLKDTANSSFVDVPVEVGPGWGFNNVLFFGVTDVAPFNAVELIESDDMTDGMLYDNVVAGIVPEPSSIALVTLAGACVLGQARRRRQS